MPLSMTAFARAETETPWGDLVWELKSVNHRYLEPALRMPEDLRRIEPQVRERISARLSRGKVDLNLRWQTRSDEAGQGELNSAVLTQVLALAQQAQEAGHQQLSPMNISDVLRWPGVVQTPKVDEAALAREALVLLDKALAELLATRQREGARMAELLVQRLDDMETVVAQVREFLPDIRDGFRQKLRDRLADIKQDLDAERIEQEIAIFAQKMDVDEELDRLTTHIGEVRRVLGEKKPVGRRLDFLMQELNREANTLGSKAADVRQTNAAVDLKVLIEQMREQVQNIE